MASESIGTLLMVALVVAWPVALVVIIGSGSWCSAGGASEGVKHVGVVGCGPDPCMNQTMRDVATACQRPPAPAPPPPGSGSSTGEPTPSPPAAPKNESAPSACSLPRCP